MNPDPALDIRAERQSPAVQADPALASAYETIVALKLRLGLPDSELRPRDCRTTATEEDRNASRQLGELTGLYRSNSIPALLNSLGIIQAALGLFDAARQSFREAAAVLPEGPARGQVRFNAYVAALVEPSWAEGLAALAEAAALDPSRFALFPREKYEPEQILGVGGFGVAFLCWELKSGRNVVIKALHADVLDRAVTDVFHEATILRDLDHPAIIRLVDQGYADNAQIRPFLCMEFFDGQSLHEYVARHGPLSPENVVALARPVAEALQAAHARGVWHRDIKPANILIRCGRTGWQVKLIDFGVALRETAGPSLIAPVGTHEYAAPEQLGQIPGAAVGPHSDVYGFGRTCMFALFGDPNYRYSSDGWDRLPGDLRELLVDCLEERPERRVPGFATILTRLPEVRTLTAPKASNPTFHGWSDAGRKFAPMELCSPITPAAAQPITAAPTTRNPAMPQSAARPMTAIVGPAPSPGFPPCPIPAQQPRAGPFWFLGPKLGGWLARRLARPVTAADHDRVDCTVFAVPEVQPGATVLVQVFAHMPDQAAEARRSAEEFDAEARSRGFRSLDTEIERGSVLMFRLALPELKIDEPVQYLTWRGRAEAVQFAADIPPDHRPGAIVGTVIVFQDSVPLGHIRFKLLVLAAGQAPDAKPAACGDEATRYRMVFVSYASKDRDEVLKRVQMLRRLKIDCFQDVLDLEPGQRWERELYRNIDRSDLFLLFWSTAAKDSKWVMKEAMYALNRKNGRENAPPEIMPVILEGPPVPLPPPELAHLHFHDPVLNFMSGPRAG